MNQIEDLKLDLVQKFGNESDFKISHDFGDDVLNVPPSKVADIVKHFKDTKRYDFLMDVCGVDYPERQKRFDVVYHFYASKNNRRLRMKAQVGEGESIPSVTPVWKGANFFEREAFDMYGIKFEGHPYLRRILLHEEFVGHPLRKDYPADLQQRATRAAPIHFENDATYVKDPSKNLIPINIGPSHPATHGTLRVMAELDGEIIHRANVELGFLHRCFEKMAETHFYNQVVPYTDRLNYCSAPMNNVGYCKTVERLLGIEIPPKAQAIRVILCELSRVIDHIVCIGANAVDLGALTTFFYLFNMRERVYSLFEKLCGARLTVSMTRVGGMANNPPEGWFDDVLETVKELKKGVEEVDKLLTNNKIWIERTKGVGGISAEDAIMYGYTGPCLRAAGVALDLRKATPYYGYDQLDFEVPYGTTGDVYDRYAVRLEEMKQSLRIVEQVAKNVPGGDYTIRDKHLVLPDKKDVYGNIEGLMNHFMLVVKGLRPPKGEIYDATEAANGELGFYLVSDGGPRPYRLKVRPPCFAIYQSFPGLITGGYLSDVVAVLGSLNLIAGELDR
jgi:NADH-quinone oxidoreductase subunit C/D